MPPPWPGSEPLFGAVVEMLPSAAVVVTTSPTFAQKLVYQFRILPRLSGVATHAASHTPLLPAEKAVNLASLQKQAL